MVIMWNSVLFLSALGSLPFASASPLEARQDTTSIPVSTITGPPTHSFKSSQPHTPFTGTPTTTGELSATSVGTGIVESASVAPAETTYPSDGKLHNAQPAPYVPAGGVGTNGSIPVYNAKSDFDYESLVCTFFVNDLWYMRGSVLIIIARLLLCTRNTLSWTCSTMACNDSRLRISRQLVLTMLTVT